MSRYIYALITLICVVVSAPQKSYAQTRDIDSSTKTVLILNSYNENQPWASSMIAPVNYYLAETPGVHSEIMYLNSSLITDSIVYQRVKDNFHENYRNRDIDYIVFIGNPAFTLREEVVELWGDIPMLLITRDLLLAPDNYYFSGFDYPIVDRSFPSIETLRPQYNFNVIFVPDYYRETIDLMFNLIPDMEEFYFFSDAIYFNRYLGRDIENYLITEYPQVKFKWVKASARNSEFLQSMFVQEHPNVGMLISSWFYEQQNAIGYPTLVSHGIDMLSASVNPVFALRQPYVDRGVVGGVFNNIDYISDVIEENLKAMLAGKQMRNLNFYMKRDNIVTIINYNKLQQYELPASKCPKDTVYINKPLTFWEKYHWQMIIVGLIILAMLYALLRRNITQRHKIERLSRHQQFVDHMPIPYTKAKIVYDEQSNIITNVNYTMSNQAFDDLIKENSDPSKPYILFSSDFISAKISEMLQNERPVTFLHQFKRSGKYYLFTLCIVDIRSYKDKVNVDNIDIFAIDVTKQQKAEEDLKAITKKLDMTIDVANLIPWDWDMKTDIMTFDAYSMFQRLKRTFDGGQATGQSKVSVAEYMKLIHPDDRHIVRTIREKFFLNQIENFTVEYRLITAKQNQQAIEWVEVKGAVAKRDKDGKPTLVMGSMTVITDRKAQETAMLKAEDRSVKANEIKEAFLKNISHEVRIQLNSIVGFAQLMRDTDDPQKRREFAEIIESDNQQLLKYIDDLSDEKSEAHTAASTPEASNKQPEQPKPVIEAKPVIHTVEHTKPEPFKPTMASGRKPLILVAEDIEGNYLLLRHLIPKDFELIHAWTGQEAVEMHRDRHPDLILMDIGMPIMDGYKATEEIRKIDNEVPIVAVTAYTFASERDLIMRSGFDEYISKPVSKEAIMGALSHYL